MGANNHFTKDPSGKWNYTIDWALLLPTGQTIDTSAWTVPAGLTTASTSKTTTTTTIVLSGGTLGTTYDVVNHIVTTPGAYEDDRTISIEIVSK